MNESISRLPNEPDTADLVLENGIVITMDAGRRVLTGATVVFRAGRIVAVEPTQSNVANYPAAKRIDCRRKVIMPGLVDMHGYLGGSILKSAGEDLDGTARRNLLEEVLSSFIDEEWWEVESRLAAVERLKLGVTCMFSMMGGNGTRTDDVRFPQISAHEVSRAGMRARIGLGPARPPWPRPYTYWAEGKKDVRPVEFDVVIDNCDRIFTAHALNPNPLIDYCVALSRIGNQNEHDPVWTPERQVWVGRQAEAAVHLMQKHDVGFWTHMYGNSIDYAFDEKLGLCGPRSVFSHCTGISERSIAIMRETGSHCAHHPRAARMYSYPGRCPLPELIDAGVNVCLGADAPQNHDTDMFLDIKAAARAQRMHFKDPRLIPPGKALEMATIDGYRALGLDHELGSVEPGKKADLITIDLAQPHMAPIDMPVYRVVYNATGRDVADVIVDGRLVMESRRMIDVDEEALLDRTQEMYARVMERAGLAQHTPDNSKIWGASRS